MARRGTGGGVPQAVANRRPGGLLLVIDFPPPPFLGRGSFGVPEQAVVREVTSAGLERLRLIEDWPGRGPLSSYCAVFRKSPWG